MLARALAMRPVLDRHRSSERAVRACNGWLVSHKILLAGVTVLERFVAEVRSRMELHLWRLLGRDVTQTQRHRLDELLKPAEGSRQS